MNYPGRRSHYLSVWKKIILDHYKCVDLREARIRATKDAYMVLSEGRMYPVHKKFLQAAQDEEENVADNMAWLKHVAMSGLETEKMPEHWTDADEAKAEFAFRYNLIWLRNASELLRENKNNKFFIAMDMGSVDVADTTHEIQKFVKDLKERFPANILGQAVAQINYCLYKEKE